MVSTAYRSWTRRRRRLIGLVGLSVAVGVVAGALIVPQFLSNAGSNGVSTIYKTAKNRTNGSVAASPDAPGGAKTGTGKPGDTIDWVVSYRNDTSRTGTVDLKDPLSKAGAYVPDSLRLPAAQIPGQPFAAQFSTEVEAPGRPGRRRRMRTASGSPEASPRPRPDCRPSSDSRSRSRWASPSTRTAAMRTTVSSRR